MSDSESNKKKVVIAESSLSSTENKEEGEEGEGEKGMMEGGAKKAKTKQAAAAAEEGEEEEKKEEQEGDKPSSPSPSPPQSPSKQKKKKEKKSGNKKLGLDVGEFGEQAKPSSADAEREMSQLLNETIPWNIIDKLFSDNPNILVAHQLDSYNEFISNGISQIFKEHNPIIFQKEKNPQTDAYKHISRLYLGGKTGDKIYYGKPVIYDETGTTSRVHYMYPNEARLRNMTYGVTIHYDVDVEFEQEQEESSSSAFEVTAASSSIKNIKTINTKTINTKTIKTVTLPQILLGKFPIMVHSNLCILSGLPKDVMYNMGEDKSDHGGYFIIDGKEKLIVSQEIFADNMLYTRTRSADDKYSHSVEIRTVSEDTSKPERKLRVYMVAPTPRYTNNQIVVEIPNVKKPIPLFILMRALGVISD